MHKRVKQAQSTQADASNHYSHNDKYFMACDMCNWNIWWHNYHCLNEQSLSATVSVVGLLRVQEKINFAIFIRVLL